MGKTFDALETSAEFLKAGFNDDQAKVLARTMHHAITDGVASKADLRAEINAAIVKMMLSQVAVAGALFAAIKLT